MAFGTDRSAFTDPSLASVCPLRPPVAVAVAVKSGLILSMTDLQSWEMRPIQRGRWTGRSVGGSPRWKIVSWTRSPCQAWFCSFAASHPMPVIHPADSDAGQPLRPTKVAGSCSPTIWRKWRARWPLSISTGSTDAGQSWDNEAPAADKPTSGREPQRSRGISLSPVSWPLYAWGGRCPSRVCRRPQARAPSWLSPMANVIHAPAIDRQHLGRDEAGIRLDQESHGGGNVLRRANPTDHGALAH